MKKVFLAVIAVIVVLAGGLMLSYNGLAGSKEAVETAEADVDTMLQRRADLIPNLVSTVKSYTKHETGVVDRVLEARDQLMNADTVEEKSEADQQMDSALSGLKVVVENYPENRLQVFFDDIPAKEIRDSLKQHGFRWSRHNSCWQSYMNRRNIDFIKELLEETEA